MTEVRQRAKANGDITELNGKATTSSPPPRQSSRLSLSVADVLRILGGLLVLNEREHSMGLATVVFEAYSTASMDCTYLFLTSQLLIEHYISSMQLRPAFNMISQH